MNTSLDEVDRLYHQAAALFQQGQHQAAAQAFAAVLQREPNLSPAHNGLGLALYSMGNQAAALERFEAAIRFDPFFASPHINRGMVLRDMGRTEAALASLEKACALQPTNANAHGNRGMVLTELQQPGAANACFERALQLDPKYPHVAGIRLLNKMYVCDWSGFDYELADLLDKVDRGEPATPPWPLLGLTDSPLPKRKVAEIWTATKAPENPALGPLRKYPRHDRIRLGYYSADYHRHATAYLIAELFERHDRGKFEVITFSFGADTGDDMQRRIAAGSTRYLDVRNRSDRDIASLSRDLEIDIAIDLKGFTLENRVGIFAHRAAPIQVNYLGYPGTMGAPYIDYIIADETVIPERARPFYTEKVVNLPGSYQVNDRKRKASDRAFTRAELGLPETGFVFCCFNNNFKITPAIFEIWVRILNAVPGSVLWLIQDNPTAAANLRRNAQAFGLDPKRLVFAARIVPDDHLARHALADLFLDTLPYNAHTTASDALWVGVPLVTCPGESFPARVAASLLNAVGLSELITPTLADYEAMAIALANDPARLQHLKQKLVRGRSTAPLFDTEAFTRNIEAAYQRMFEDLHTGQPPQSFTVA
jgi:predicted O-linked N-acetylglucosamine transferase (SPINDLY family)